MRVLKLGQSLVSNSKAPAAFKNLYSLDFDGVDDVVNMGNVSDLSFDYNEQFTFSFWVKRDRTGTAEGLVSKMERTGNYNGLLVLFNSSNLIQFVLRNKNISSQKLNVYSQGTITDNDWHHIAVTYNGAGNTDGVTVFIDGQDDTNRATASGTISATSENSESFTMGAWNTTTGYNFQGHLDELAVFSDAKHSTVINNIYNSGSPTDLSGESNLVGYFRNGDPTGTAAFPTIIDQSTNSNNGTMQNMASGDIVTDVP